jgi:hypothetical protein
MTRQNSGEHLDIGVADRSLDHRSVEALHSEQTSLVMQAALTRPFRNTLTFLNFISARTGDVAGFRAAWTVWRIWLVSCVPSYREDGWLTFSRSAATRFVCSSSGALTARL